MGMLYAAASQLRRGRDTFTIRSSQGADCRRASHSLSVSDNEQESGDRLNDKAC